MDERLRRETLMGEGHRHKSFMNEELWHEILMDERLRR